jgi:transcriptional regulator with XRE-family HTH domain
MILRTRNYVAGVSSRLKIVRSEQNYSRKEMAARLGISQTNIYKNETGICFPRMDTLHHLHKDFDISMDWLMFGSKPMHNKEKQPIIAAEKKTSGLENSNTDVRELLDTMEQDHILMYEILLYFQKYKKNRERETVSREPINEPPALP